MGKSDFEENGHNQDGQDGPAKPDGPEAGRTGGPEPEDVPAPAGDDAPGQGGPQPASGPEGSDEELGELGTQALAKALHGAFTFLKWAMVLLLIGYFASGVFVVQPGELRLKTRFGRPVSNLLKEGALHIRWPIETVKIIPRAEEVMTLETEFWPGKDAGGSTQSLNVKRDGFLLTGDANIVHMQLRIRYRRSESEDGVLAYLFSVKDAETILSRTVMSSAVSVVASMGAMDVIRKHNLFERITRDAKERIEAFKDSAGVPLGLDLVAVEAVEIEGVKNPTEPRNVSEAFRAAQNADDQKDKIREDGRGRSNSIREKARARASEIIAEAEGYSERLVKVAEADAETIRKLRDVYGSSPAEAAILRDTIFQRTLLNMLSRAGDVFVFYAQPEGTSRELRLQIGREPSKTKIPGKDEQQGP